MQGQVQKETVEYNTAVYGMQNQLVLLNIARAKDGLPTFYTSISRLSGAITVKAVAGAGAQIKAAQPTTTSAVTNQSQTGGGTSTSALTQTGSSASTTPMNGTSTTQSVSTGSAGNTLSQTTSGSTATMSGTSAGSSLTTGAMTTAANNLTNLAQTVVASGGNIYAPSVSGEIDSGPSFDINILDTQQFYQGVLSGIDGATMSDLIDQGVDHDTVLRLLIYRVEFRAKEKTTLRDDDGPFDVQKGEVVSQLTNAAPVDSLSIERANEFWRFASCYQLMTAEMPGEPRPIALASRVVVGGDDAHGGLKLSDLASLDGTQLALAVAPAQDPKAPPGAKVDPKDIYLGSSKTPDPNLLIVKPAQPKEVIVLYKINPSLANDTCGAPGEKYIVISKDKPPSLLPVNLSASNFNNNWVYIPDRDRSGSVKGYSGQLKRIQNGVEDKNMDIKVDAVLIPRSPEATVEYLGAYLRYLRKHPTELALQSGPLFNMIEGRCKNELVGVDLLEKHYCLDGEVDGDGQLTDAAMRNMQILSLLEQLINLNKSAATRPATLPVEVVAGG